MNKEDSFKLLDAFVEAGGNFIDTAVSSFAILFWPRQRLEFILHTITCSVLISPSFYCTEQLPE